MADVTMKQNDSRPILSATLKEGDPAAPTAINLTTATSVRFLMRSGATNVVRAATVVTPASGIVTVTFLAADTAVAGNYEGEFEITWPGGALETVPNDGYLSIEIVDDIA